MQLKILHNDQDQEPKMLSTQEGRILEIGFILTLLGIGGLALCWIWKPDLIHLLLAMTATNIIFGRASSISFGLAFGINPILNISMSILIETILVMVFYPLFVFSWKHLVIINQLNKLFQKINDAAEKNQKTIQRYGLIGIFAFVWFPFWMTGPLVGCVIGFLLKLPAWRIISTVLLGTYAATLVWAYFLIKLHTELVALSPYALFGIIIILAIAYQLINRIRNKK